MSCSSREAKLEVMIRRCEATSYRAPIDLDHGQRGGFKLMTPTGSHPFT